MEIVGITRIKDGKEVEEFVVGCSDHQYWFKGRPPLTSGCQQCWHAYFFAQTAMAGGDIRTNVDTLESAIRHTAEAADKGEFDFKPETPKVEIEYDVD